MFLITIGIFGLTVLCFFIWLFIDNISSSDVGKCTIITSYLGILISTLPIIVLPLDIINSILITEENGYLSILILRFWQLTYCVIFILCWIIYPILFEYELCGEFDSKSKLRNSLERNKRFWFIQSTFILIILLLYVIVFNKHNLNLTVPSIFIAVGHFWGMIQIIFLWGFGLVAIPYEIKSRNRNCNLSNIRESLNNMYIVLHYLDDYKAINMHEIAKVKTNLRQIYSKSLDENIKEKVNEILSYIIENSESDVHSKDHYRNFKETNVYTSNASTFSIKKKTDFSNLVDLNRETKLLIAEKRRIFNQWSETLKNCWNLEDQLFSEELNSTQNENIPLIFSRKYPELISKNLNNKFSEAMKNPIRKVETEKDHLIQKQDKKKFRDISNYKSMKLTKIGKLNLNDCFIYIYNHSYINMIFYFFTFISSSSIILAEATTYFPQINISLFSHIIKFFSRIKKMNYYLKIILIYTICKSLFIYIYICTFWGLFIVKLPKKYGIYFKKQTDGPCIVFFSQFLCKLSTSLCFHYLSIIRIDNTVFNSFYGRPMQFLPIIFGKDFNSLYFPILVVLLFVFNLFNLQGKLIKFTGIYFLFFDYYVLDEESNGIDTNLISSESQEIILNGMKISESRRIRKENERIFRMV